VPKTKISKKHEAAAKAMQEALAASGVECTVSECLLAMYISNAVELTVAAAEGGELAEELGRYLYKGNEAAVPCVFLARAVLQLTSTPKKLSMEAKGTIIGSAMAPVLGAIQASINKERAGAIELPGGIRGLFSRFTTKT